MAFSNRKPLWGVEQKGKWGLHCPKSLIDHSYQSPLWRLLKLKPLSRSNRALRETKAAFLLTTGNHSTQADGVMNQIVCAPKWMWLYPFWHGNNHTQNYFFQGNMTYFGGGDNGWIDEKITVFSFGRETGVSPHQSFESGSSDSRLHFWQAEKRLGWLMSHSCRKIMLCLMSYQLLKYRPGWSSWNSCLCWFDKLCVIVSLVSSHLIRTCQ